MMREKRKGNREKEKWGARGGQEVCVKLQEDEKRQEQGEERDADGRNLFFPLSFLFCCLPSNSMHVVLYREWKRHVQDKLHLGDIESSSRHVGCHQ